MVEERNLPPGSQLSQEGNTPAGCALVGQGPGARLESLEPLVF